MEEVSKLLRAGLLRDVTIMLASTPAPGVGRLAPAMREACEALGATLIEWPLASGEEASAAALRGGGPVDLLAVDGGGAFAAALDGGPGEERNARVALASCVRCSWEVTRSFALELIERQRAGRIVLIAPAVRDGEEAPRGGGERGAVGEEELASYARAARAGLENLARTLSIEWARHAITTVAIAPSPDTAAGEIAALCAYLASPAGAYFSGCLLPLGGLPARPRP